MSNLLSRKETGLIITVLLIFIIIFMVIIKVPETKDVVAQGLPEGAIESENVLVDGAVINTITFSTTGQRNVYQYGITVAPIITTEQMVDWSLKKSNELIAILQELAFPFCVITFILATFITLIGCLAKRAGQGIIGMSASLLGYAAILYAPMIVNVVVYFVSK